jgi:hypothetical protein
MNRMTATKTALAATLSLILVLMAGVAIAAESLRPAVGRPLQSAQKLIQARKYKEALGPIGEAEKVGDLTDDERITIARMKGSALAGAGDADGSAAAFEKALVSRRISRDEKLRIMESVAGSYFRAKNYPKAVLWVRNYEAQGGRSAAVLNLLPQAHYLAGDYAKAAQEASQRIAAAEKTGGKPDEELLKLLASSLQKKGDATGYARAMESLVRHYPTPAYWADVIQRTANRPGISRNLELDAYRLKHATGTLTQVRDYMEAAQLAMQADLPGEAKRYIDEAYDRKIFGTGEAAKTERQSRLRVMVEKNVEEDRKAVGDAGSAKTSSGDALVRTGLAWITYGDEGKGLELMEQGIRKGGLKFPNQSKLHLAYAYYLAGDEAKARTAFSEVQGTDGAADFARLWAIVLGPG